MRALPFVLRQTFDAFTSDGDVWSRRWGKRASLKVDLEVRLEIWNFVQQRDRSHELSTVGMPHGKRPSRSGHLDLVILEKENLQILADARTRRSCYGDFVRGFLKLQR